MEISRLTNQQIAEVALQVEAVVRNRHGKLAALVIGIPKGLASEPVIEALHQRLEQAGLKAVTIDSTLGSNNHVELVSLEFRW